ncbi:hypothetical protein HPB47_021612 [Ixodes persulcatus]|uniref:Uncharacterized protein n=1 Tax=Ixodes persulcatus TaxID=34615 RepID=A0AC60QD16_IXOPE|nr:hypothetical protein HPB47_021612 [Ixodes persulcatus]
MKFPASFDVCNVKQALEYQARPGDVILSTYPKSGTTWMQYIVWCLCHMDEMDEGRLPNIGRMLAEEFPYIDASRKIALSVYRLMGSSLVPCEAGTTLGVKCTAWDWQAESWTVLRLASSSTEVGTDVLKNRQPPRLIKHHLPQSMSPHHPEAKHIVVVRNPFDVFVSWVHAKREALGVDCEDVDTLLHRFLSGDLEYGCYFEHLFSWYAKRGDTNVLLVYYERLKEDFKSVALEIAHFLDVPEVVKRLDQGLVDKLQEVTSLKNLRLTSNLQLKRCLPHPSQLLSHSQDCGGQLRVVTSEGGFKGDYL